MPLIHKTISQYINLATIGTDLELFDKKINEYLKDEYYLSGHVIVTAIAPELNRSMQSFLYTISLGKDIAND